jgi:hypothetical protein
MKKVFLFLITFTVLSSCKKKDNDPYALPWKTEFIHYENIYGCSGYHSNGYKLFYKDLLLKEECIDYAGPSISDSLLVNDSILHLFFVEYVGSYVLSTTNGGYTWDDFTTGPPNLLKLHLVNTKLTYCITHDQNKLFFTGIGKSNLSLYIDSLTIGTHYISDFGTNVLDIDSTVIGINDSVNFVILFK